MGQPHSGYPVVPRLVVTAEAGRAGAPPGLSSRSVQTRPRSLCRWVLTAVAGRWGSCLVAGWWEAVPGHQAALVCRGLGSLCPAPGREVGRGLVAKGEHGQGSGSSTHCPKGQALAELVGCGSVPGTVSALLVDGSGVGWEGLAPVSQDRRPQPPDRRGVFCLPSVQAGSGAANAGATLRRWGGPLRSGSRTW